MVHPEFMSRWSSHMKEGSSGKTWSFQDHITELSDSEEKECEIKMAREISNRSIPCLVSLHSVNNRLWFISDAIE